MDGLERLIVICVGLDESMGSEDANALEARSLLYRAVTRAHMMVLVVNEFVPDGWFAFLSRPQPRELVLELVTLGRCASHAWSSNSVPGSTNTHNLSDTLQHSHQFVGNGKTKDSSQED